MTTLNGSLTAIAKTLVDIDDEFPFESRLSLAALIRFWDGMAREDSVRGELARSLQTRLREAPELHGPIEDLSVLDRHRSLLDALMGAVFPPAFLDQSHSAALMPFKLRSIYGTHAFERNLMSPDGEVQGQLNLDERSLKSFRLLNAYALALYRLYGIESHVDYPLIFTTRDAETGLDRHFKIYFDGSFLDVEPLRPFPPLAEEVRQRLDAHAVDADGLAALIPPGSVRFSGFTVFKAVAVTDQEVLSSIKRDLIDKESIVSNARFEALQAKLRTLFHRPELRLSLAAIEGRRVLILNSGHRLQSGCIFADSIHHKVADFAGSIYERAIARGEPIFVEDVAAAAVRSTVEDAILKKGMRSVVIAPLHYQREPIGTLSLTSPNPGDINSLLAPRLQEVLPKWKVHQPSSGPSGAARSFVLCSSRVAFASSNLIDRHNPRPFRTAAR